MECLLAFVIGTALLWVLLLIMVPIAQKLADFGLPAWPEMLWKLAAIAALGNGVGMVMNRLDVHVSWVVGALVLWVLIFLWFRADAFGATVVVVVSWIVHLVLDKLFLATLVNKVLSAAG